MIKKIDELNNPPPIEMNKAEQIQVLRRFGEDLDELLRVCKEWVSRTADNENK